MPHFRFRFSKPTPDSNVRVKLFGIGSAGCNVIEGQPLPTVAFSTSDEDLARSGADRKFRMSFERLAGLSGPEGAILKLLPTLAGHELLDLFNNTDLAFLMSGLGGTTGSLGSRLLSLVARSKNVPSVSMVTFPFSAESVRRREVAQSALGAIMKNVNLCLVFDNDKLSSLAPNLQLSRAFAVMNGIMTRPARDICSAMARPDIATFSQAVEGSEYARFGLGLARGDERVERVVAEALSSPWFDYEISETAAAVVIYSATDPWEKEAESIISRIEERLPSAKLLWGSYSDPSLGERIRISLILCRNRQ